MKQATKAVKDYKLSYKKKSATTDSYLPRGASRSVSVCESCHAVYRNKRWYAEGGVAVMTDVRTTVCPACLKIRDNFPGGIVTLRGAYVLPHKDDLMQLIRKEESRAHGLNPLERIMSVKENGFGSLVVSTTNEKLAQRIGRAVRKAFHGEVTYQFSHDNKLARVEWVRE